MPCRGCGKNPVGPSGKSAKRCQWQRKRAGFEEVPRLADTTVTGNRFARRWATAGPYGGVVRGAMGGRPQGSPLRSFTRSALRADRGILPYGGFTDRISQGLPTPFLHISCSLCVDFLWIIFPSPFLPPSCGNSSFPLWKKNPCISRPYGGFPQKFSLRLLLLKNT